jgi:hypothetical protein
VNKANEGHVMEPSQDSMTREEDGHQLMVTECHVMVDLLAQREADVAAR